MAGPVSTLGVVGKFWSEYLNQTGKRLKIIDAYLLYILLTGIFQFLYCCLVGTFPFNSFLSGFISSVASFVLAGKYIMLCTRSSSLLHDLWISFNLA
jgi:oligosaccharyltransferase complex subunit epsilon